MVVESYLTYQLIGVCPYEGRIGYCPVDFRHSFCKFRRTRKLNIADYSKCVIRYANCRPRHYRCCLVIPPYSGECCVVGDCKSFFKFFAGKDSRKRTVEYETVSDIAETFVGCPTHKSISETENFFVRNAGNFFTVLYFSVICFDVFGNDTAVKVKYYIVFFKYPNCGKGCFV